MKKKYYLFLIILTPFYTVSFGQVKLIEKYIKINSIKDRNAYFLDNIYGKSYDFPKEMDTYCYSVIQFISFVEGYYEGKSNYNALLKDITDSKSNLVAKQTEKYDDFIADVDDFIEQSSRYAWREIYPTNREKRKQYILSKFESSNPDTLRRFLNSVKKFEKNNNILKLLEPAITCKINQLSKNCWDEDFLAYERQYGAILTNQSSFYESSTEDIVALVTAGTILDEFYFIKEISERYFRPLLLSHKAEKDRCDLIRNSKFITYDKQITISRVDSVAKKLEIKAQSSGYSGLHYFQSKIEEAIYKGECQVCEQYKDSLAIFLMKHQNEVRLAEESKAAFLSVISKESCYSGSLINLTPIPLSEINRYINKRVITDADERLFLLEIPKNTKFNDILKLYECGIEDPSDLHIIFNRLRFFNIDYLAPNHESLKQAGKKLKTLTPDSKIDARYLYLPNLAALSLKFEQIQGDDLVRSYNINQLIHKK